MKWSWKIFAIHLVLILTATIATAVGVSKIFDFQRGANAPDSTLVSMGIAGFLVPFIYAGISGWKLWNLKMLLILSVVISGLLSCNPMVAVPTIPLVILIYFLTSKARQMLSYFSPRPPISDESENQQAPR